MTKPTYDLNKEVEEMGRLLNVTSNKTLMSYIREQLKCAYNSGRSHIDIIKDSSRPSCFGRRLGSEACNHKCPVSNECYSD